MRTKAILVLGCLLILAAGGFAWLRRDLWIGWFEARTEHSSADAEHAHSSPEQVRLSPQAIANLGLAIKPLRLESYWRTLPLPGMVVERPGKSDRGVTASIAGVVRQVKAVPGDMVRPGDELFTLRLVSESLQTSQTELYKTAQELEITQDQKKRLEKGGLVPEARLLEFDYQIQRLNATMRAMRQDLAARGLTPEQISAAAEGKFLREITVRVPSPPAEPRETELPPVYEVEELKVQLGEQVQAGQVLCTLANHQALYLEGRVFKHEVPLIERTVQEGWPVQVEIAEAAPAQWAALDPRRILFLGNRVDPASQTVPVYLPLVNQYREYQTEDRTFRVWRFRPGQRVRLEVPVERFDKVFVLPTAAIAREGAEAYVFRHNDEAFERRPVHLVYADRQHVIVSNDGSLFEGNRVAMSGAAQLQRTLKAQAVGEQEHDHEGHEHHHHHDH